MSAEPAVQVEGLWTVYDDLVVHRDLDLKVMPGEVVSLVGGSGSGKTTLLRQLLGRELHAFDEDFIRDLVMLKLDAVGIPHRHASTMPADLSGGMIKRIALARALVLDPELVFLDEPTAGLDPDRSEAFVKLIRDLHDKLNFTVVMATHDLDTLVSVSDRVAVLADQKVVAFGHLDEVVRVDHPFIRNFFLGERGLRALSAAPSLQID